MSNKLPKESRRKARLRIFSEETIIVSISLVSRILRGPRLLFVFLPRLPLADINHRASKPTPRCPIRRHTQ